MFMRLFGCTLLFLIIHLCVIGQTIYEPPEKDKKTKITGHPILMYTPETRWVFGAAGVLLINNFDSTSLLQNPSIVNPFFFITLNKQFWLVTRAELYNDNRLTNVRVEAGRVPDYFYGIGMNTTSENEKFTMQTYGLHYEWLTYIDRKIVVGFSTKLNYNHISDVESGILLNREFPGMLPGFTGGVGPSFQFDSRNSTTYPLVGWFIKSTFTYLPPVFKGDYSYASIEFDIRKYVTSLNLKNTLAFQIVHKNIAGKNIPFYELKRLGGETRLRGIHSNRYIDNHLAFTQLEYRRELPFIFGLVCFAGTGTVFNNFQSFHLKNLVFNYGAGLRIKLIPEENVNFRLDFGFASNGENGIYVGIQEVF
jgi:hypothetical protein